MKQSEATIKAILSTLQERDVEYELGGTTTINEVLTSEDKATIRATLFTQFQNNEIDMKEESKAKYLSSDSELKTYVSGLVNNWTRKHKPFNNGQAYVAKNPGSRAHSSDEQMKELKKLLNQVTPTGDEDAINEVKAAIELRKSEIKPKSVVKPINVDALPEHLQHLVKSTTDEDTSEA